MLKPVLIAFAVILTAGPSKAEEVWRGYAFGMSRDHVVQMARERNWEVQDEGDPGTTPQRGRALAIEAVGVKVPVTVAHLFDKALATEAENSNVLYITIYPPRSAMNNQAPAGIPADVLDFAAVTTVDEMDVWFEFFKGQLYCVNVFPKGTSAADTLQQLKDHYPKGTAKSQRVLVGSMAGGQPIYQNRGTYEYMGAAIHVYYDGDRIGLCDPKAWEDMAAVYKAQKKGGKIGERKKIF